MVTSGIADSVGRVLGERYRLTRPVGAGASAVVYAAEDVRLRRRVAVKLLHPGLAGEEAFLRRFHREAQAAASLRHPHILRVYDWGDDGGSPYLVMELLEGGTLRSMLDRGALLSAAQAAAIGAGAAKALAHAHRHGLVHRDIKPANLVFDDEGHLYVADFGLARALAEAAWTEPNGAVVGTARYASPELVRGEQLDAKADVYSLALVLVEAMTGQVPFAADTAVGSLMGRLARPLEPPAETGPLAAVLTAAGTLTAADRLDAVTFARRLDEVGARLPFPAPLSLASPLDWDGLPDDINPTVLPGRPRLFDVERADAAGTGNRETGGTDGGSGTGGTGSGGSGTGGTAGTRATAGGSGTDPGGTSPGGATMAGGTAVGSSGGIVPPIGAAEPDIGSGGTGADGAASNVTTAVTAAATTVTAGPSRWRRWRRRALAIVLAVFVLTGGAAAWAIGTGRLEPEENVPALVGLSQAQAAAAVKRVHLRLEVTGSAYNPRPAGLVISQVPPTGRLRQGRDVAVVVSRGPAPVPVPAVAGDTLQAAEQVLGALGIKWVVTTATSMTVSAGEIISTTPDQGTIVPGQTMSLVESTGKPRVLVPAIGTGSEPAAQAEAALSAVGLGYMTTSAYSDTVAKGDVLAADPAPGTSLPVGSDVTLTVSLGPHYVDVPSVANDSVGSATETLDADGFDVTGVDGSPIGTVTSTNPPAGRQVLYGSSIVIVTG